MTDFVFALIFLGGAIACWLTRRSFIDKGKTATDERMTIEHLRARKWAKGLLIGAIALLVLAILCGISSSWRKVGTKEEGIGLVYGSTHGRYGPGPHFTWPWVTIKEMDAAIQTDSFIANDCIQVRIANQQTGCVDLSFQWRIKKEAVDTLYQNYRSFDHVRDALVTRRLGAAVNEVLAHYNPLASITLTKGSTTPTYADLDRQVSDLMRTQVGARGIHVISTVIKLIHYDPATQARINQLQQQVAQTAIAVQEKETNIEKAKANNKLSASVDTSPNVLVSRCLDTLEQMVKNSQDVPAGFSCWPGGSNLSGVIATAK